MLVFGSWFGLVVLTLESLVVIVSALVCLKDLSPKWPIEGFLEFM